MTKETNKFHALQLFTDTFTAETVHLTNEAIGIYIRLFRLSNCRVSILHFQSCVY